MDVEKEVAGSARPLPELKVTASSGAVHPDALPVRRRWYMRYFHLLVP